MTEGRNGSRTGPVGKAPERSFQNTIRVLFMASKSESRQVCLAVEAFSSRKHKYTCMWQSQVEN